MVTASAAILLSGKVIQRRSVVVGGAAGVVGLLVGLWTLGEPSEVFWAARVPEAYIKVTFTVVLAALAYIVYLGLDEDDCGMPRLDVWNARMWIGLVAAGFFGGVGSALLGSGTDVLVFLFIVIIAGLHPRVGVPTSVLAMAMVSMVGFVVLGVADGQLATVVDGGAVVSVSGAAAGPYPAAQFDLFGMWLAAVPIVVWGAPLGTVFVHALEERKLIAFVAAIATLEVVSTAVFLTELWTNPILALYAVVGLVCALGLVRWLHANRAGLLAEAAPPESLRTAAR